MQEQHRLGKGGYGVVVAAINRLDGRKYAVKCIPLDESPSSSDRIKREVETLSRLQHPHVVRYFQVMSSLGLSGCHHYVNMHLTWYGD